MDRDEDFCGAADSCEMCPRKSSCTKLDHLTYSENGENHWGERKMSKQDMEYYQDY